MSFQRRRFANRVRLNRRSPLTRGLWALWSTYTKTDKYIFDYVKNVPGRFENTTSDPDWKYDAELGWTLDFPTGSPDNYIRPNVTTYTFNLPVTFLCRGYYQSSPSWAAFMANRDGSNIMGLIRDDAGNLCYLWNNVGWAFDGPALRTNTLAVWAVTIQSGNTICYQVTSAGTESATDTTAHSASQSISVGAFRLGSDTLVNRQVVGNFDLWGIWNRILSRSEIESFYKPDIRWDIFTPTSPRFVVAVPEVAAAPVTKVGRRKKLGWTYSKFPPGDFELNKDSRQARGLVAWWPLIKDRGANVVRDYSLPKYGGNGTLTNNATWEAENLFLPDDAGDNNYVDFGDRPDLEFVTNYTVSAWVRVDAEPSYSLPAIVSGQNRDTNGEKGWFLTYETSTNKFRWYIYDTAWRFLASSTTLTPGDGTWYHVLGVHAGSMYSIYINGVQEAGPTSIGNTTYFTGNYAITVIGKYSRDNASTRSFLGAIRDVRIYNRALSAAEIWNLYAPSTRWELYQPVIPRFVVAVPEVAATQITDLQVTALPGPTFSFVAKSPAAAVISVSTAVNLSSITPDNVALAILRQISQAANLTSVTPDTVDITIASQVSTAVNITSLTPDNLQLTVARSIATSLTLTSITPDVVDIEIASQITSAINLSSLTSDVVELTISKLVSTTIALTSLTPDVAEADILRSVSVAVSLTSVTTDLADITITSQITAAVNITSLTPDGVELTISKLISTAIVLTSLTPDTAQVAVLRNVSTTATLTSITTDLADITITSQISTTIAVSSTTPDTAILEVQIVFVSSISLTSLTPDDVDLSLAAVINPVTAISLTSLTPDNLDVTVSAQKQTAIALNSVTPDNAVSEVLRQLSQLTSLTSVTPDVADLTISKLVTSAISLTSATPDVVEADIARLVTASLVLTSLTPDTIDVEISSQVSTAVALTSLTPDNVNLSVTAAIFVSTTISLTSATPDNLSVLITRQLVVAVALSSTTPDNATLSIGVLVNLSSTIILTSITPDDLDIIVLSQGQAVIVLNSTTPDNVALSRQVGSITDVTLTSITPDTIDLLSLALIASAISVSSVTPDINVLILRQLLLTILVNSLTADIEADVFRPSSSAIALTSLTNTATNLAIREVIGKVRIGVAAKRSRIIFEINKKET